MSYSSSTNIYILLGDDSKAWMDDVWDHNINNWLWDQNMGLKTFSCQCEGASRENSE